MLKRHFPALYGLLGELFAWAVVIGVMLAPYAQGQQDIQVIGGTNPYIILGRGIQWGGSGTGNLNNNFIFSPVDPNQGFCLFLSNNNPSSSHSVSVSVSQTGDPALHSFQGFSQKWFGVATTTTFPTTVSALGIVGINYKTTASAGITVSFSGATTQAGSPDTVDVFAVQTNQSACGSLPINSVQGPFLQGVSVTNNQQFPVLIGGLLVPGSTTSVQGFAVGPNANGFVMDAVNSSLFGNGLFASPVSNSSSPEAVKIGGTARQIIMGVVPMAGFGPGFLKSGAVRTNTLEMATDLGDFAANATPAFSALGKVTNPAAGATIFHSFDQTAATKNLQYKWAILSCSAACELTINRTSAQGTTCTALTVHNLQIGNNGTNLGPAATDVAENACTTAPTATFTLADLQLPANGVTQLDIGGILNATGNTSGAGLDIICVGAVTGIVTATLEWTEE